MLDFFITGFLLWLQDGNTIITSTKCHIGQSFHQINVTEEL